MEGELCKIAHSQARVVHNHKCDNVSASHASIRMNNSLHGIIIGDSMLQYIITEYT